MKIRNVTNNEANPKIPKIIESSHRLVFLFFISFADINIEMSKIIEKMKFGVRINGVGGNCAGTPSFMTFSLVTIAFLFPNESVIVAPRIMLSRAMGANIFSRRGSV